MEFPDKEGLKKRFGEYTDIQLLEILNNQNEYQELAVEAAKEIASERGLVYREQDLPAPGVHQAHTYSRTLFPFLNSQEQEHKMLKSLITVLYLIALIPFVLAVLSYAGGYWQNSAVLGGFTVFWAVTTFGLDRKREAKIVYLHYFLFILFQIYYLISFGAGFLPGTTDIAIYVIAVLLVLYVLSYTYLILKREKKI